MSKDLIERLLASHPEWYGDVNTIYKEAADRIKELEAENAALKASEQQLREALVDTTDFLEHHSNRLDGINGKHPNDVAEVAREALAQPSDTTVLEAMIVKAGEVMRERMLEMNGDWSAMIASAIRALPAVTLNDLK